jgi:murein DD-endopeptidase MepM/ murein hydrolase activator NlpD
MVGFLVRFVAMAFVAVLGWVLGTVYPAPAAMVNMINPKAVEVRMQRSLTAFDAGGILDLLSDERRAALQDAVLKAQAAAGKAITVERVSLEDLQYESPLADAAAQAMAARPGAPAVQRPAPVTALAAANLAFEPSLSACPAMSVSNGPRTDAQRKVVNYAPVVKVGAVKLAANPTKGACLSSGFGPRNGRTHRGVDYHSRDGGPILAAGDGTVLELKYRDDYGNMLLIDHGNGVYTRYAHLATFQSGLAVGARVKAGDQIGLMGNTAGYAVPIHLHYEVLTGDYANPKASFGLVPQNVLAAPSAL